jgi:hypothetical protein
LGAPVECSHGTRLRNAPEIRHRTTDNRQHRDIETAIQTDIYSFGLLVWDILKKGQSYFEHSWCDSNLANEETMETYLNTLPPNGLLRHALQYVSTNASCAEFVACVSKVFCGSLLDDPTKRLGIQLLGAYLSMEDPEYR